MRRGQGGYWLDWLRGGIERCLEEWIRFEVRLAGLGLGSKESVDKIGSNGLGRRRLCFNWNEGGLSEALVLRR